MVKAINSVQYHIWTDALHARELARKTASDYDRGAYVRWTIQAAWTAFETVCDDALGAKLGNRFKVLFNEAVNSKGLPQVDWSQGVWQRILKVYEQRKKFTHVIPSISRQDLFPPVAAADQAIADLRDGIIAVCTLVGSPLPAWVADDDDRGWSKGSGTSAHLTAIHHGASPDDPNAVRIAYVSRGKEHFCDIAPPGTDFMPLLDGVPRLVVGQVEALRAYRGTTLLEERPITIRG
jgi:hypothetical protein